MQPHTCLTMVCCLLEFYILVTSVVTSGWASACNNVNSWQLYSAAPLENQVDNTII